MTAGLLVGWCMISLGCAFTGAAVTWGLMQRKASNKKSPAGRARTAKRTTR